MDKKKMGTASLVLSLVSLFPLLLSPSNIKTAEIFVVVFVILAIASIILGFMSKKEAKGLAISGIVIGIISLIFLCLALIGFVGISNATNCIDNGDETSTCMYNGVEIEVPNIYLREDQKEK